MNVLNLFVNEMLKDQACDQVGASAATPMNEMQGSLHPPVIPAKPRRRPWAGLHIVEYVLAADMIKTTTLQSKLLAAIGAKTTKFRGLC